MSYQDIHCSLYAGDVGILAYDEADSDIKPLLM
jgi:hypothetical protein